MTPSPRAALFISCAGHALCHGSKIALPSLTLSFAAREFDVGEDAIGLVLSAYIGGMALASVPAGLLGDRYGSARVLAAFFWLMALAALACSASHSFHVLLASHALLGVAAGLFHPAGLTLVSLSVPAEGLGKAMGLFGVVGGLGWFSGPLLMQTGLGWRAGFVGLAIASVVGAVTCHELVRRGLLQRGPTPHPIRKPKSGGVAAAVRSHRGLLVALLLAMGVNAFLLDGFVALFPETVKSLGTWIVEEHTLVAAVMGVGAIGQYVGGILARDSLASTRYATLLVLQALTLFSLSQALGQPAWPFLLMGSFAFMNFMTQPIENKLLAVFTSAQRRSMAYALKFVVALVIALPAPWLVTSLYSRAGWGFGAVYRLLALVGMAGVFAGIVYLRGTNRVRPRRAG